MHGHAGQAAGGLADQLNARTLDRVTRVKFCGITRVEDAELAAELGAWAVGLIFWPGSPRRCPPEQAAAVAAAVRRRVEVAGVFVNAHLDEVAATADTVGLTLIQLHGDEGPAYCSEVARRTGAKVIKAARVGLGRRRARPAPIPHGLPPARHPDRGAIRRHGPDLGLEPGRGRTRARRSSSRAA